MLYSKGVITDLEIINLKFIELMTIDVGLFFPSLSYRFVIVIHGRN